MSAAFSGDGNMIAVDEPVAVELLCCWPAGGGAAVSAPLGVIVPLQPWINGTTLHRKDTGPKSVNETDAL